MLGHGHRLRYGHAQFATCLLLERRGGERRCGVALGRLLLGLDDREGGADALCEEFAGLLLGLEACRQLGLEERLLRITGGMELCNDPEVGRRAEGDDLTLALDNQPHGDRLHTPGRECGPDLFPQHGREFEADQTVEDAARLLGVHEVHVHRTGVLDGLEDRTLGDFVEDDAFRLIDRETQHFGQVPCDGLSFAVFIGCEPYGFRLREFGEFIDDLLLVSRNLVDGLEPFVDVDSEVFFREVADVSETRFDDIIRAEELFDGLGLGRGLDDD